MYEYTAHVVRVVDGDTVDLDIDLGLEVWKRTRVRLASINTSELNSSDPDERARAVKAKTWLDTALHAGLKVRATTYKDKREKYGRYLATIYTPSNPFTSVNETLVRMGLADWYMKGEADAVLDL